MAEQPPKQNRECHEQHRMPPKATTDQRIAWHLEHARHCSCRPMPEKLRQIIEERERATQ